VEEKRLVELFEKAREKYQKDLAQAEALATKPLGPVPNGMSAIDLAAWTVIGNVLLNLDETLGQEVKSQASGGCVSAPSIRSAQYSGR